MIREFWIENFMSINDRQTINFESKLKEDDFFSVSIKKTRINKLGVIYGANASGKSNMLIAMENVFNLLFRPKNDRNDLINQYQPFALNKDKPVKAYLSFFASEKRYDYYISYYRNYIADEKLYYYPEKSRSLFYSREFKSLDVQADIKFGVSVGLRKETLNTITSNTLNNHTVLSLFSKISLQEDAEPISELYNWIKNYVHQINGDHRKTIVELMKEVAEDKKLKNFYLKMLKKADFNIIDFEMTTKAKDLPAVTKKAIENSSNLTQEEKDKLINEPVEDVMFNSSAGNDKFALSGRLQSVGTLRYIERLRLLYNLISGNHIYFIDELEMNLHYDLLLYFLNVFIYNSSESQLIFTTQEVTLLSEELLNCHRDSVFFVEKSYDTASSTLIRADEYGLHKNMSLYNSYRIGRLGAKPELGSPFIDAE